MKSETTRLEKVTPSRLRELVPSWVALSAALLQLVDDAEPEIQLGAFLREALDARDLRRQRARLRVDVGDRVLERGDSRVLRQRGAGDHQTRRRQDHGGKDQIVRLETEDRLALGLALPREQIDADHFFSPSRRKASPIPTVRRGATFMTSCPANSAGSY